MPKPRQRYNRAQNVLRLGPREHAVRLQSVIGLAAICVKADGTPNVRAIKRAMDEHWQYTGDDAYHIGEESIREYLAQARDDPAAVADARRVILARCPPEHIVHTLMRDYDRMESEYHDDLDTARARRLWHQSRTELRTQALGIIGRLGALGDDGADGGADTEVIVL